MNAITNLSQDLAPNLSRRNFLGISGVFVLALACRAARRRRSRSWPPAR